MLAATKLWVLIILINNGLNCQSQIISLRKGYWTEMLLFAESCVRSWRQQPFCVRYFLQSFTSFHFVTICYRRKSGSPIESDHTDGTKLGSYQFLDINYNDPENVTREVQLRSPGLAGCLEAFPFPIESISGIDMEGTDNTTICLQAWYQLKGGPGYPSSLEVSLR